MIADRTTFKIRSGPWSLAAIALTMLVMLVNLLMVRQWTFEDRVIEYDAIGYYGFLPAALIHHDLSLRFVDHYQGPHQILFKPRTSPTGNPVMKVTMGLSLLWLPFFGAGHVTALLTGADAGGFSPPYKFWLLVAALSYLLLGLVYLRRILRTWCSDRVTALTILAFAFGTHMYWYSLFQSTMAHIPSFALITVFIWYAMQWHDRQGHQTAWVRGGSAARLGLLFGLITLVRPSNVLVGLVFLSYGALSPRAFLRRLGALLREWPFLVLMAAVAVIVWLPQMFYWHALAGQWLYNSYGDQERFFFADPAIVAGLFGWRKGLFMYTPLLVFAVAGMVLLWKQRSPFALVITLFAPLNAYVILSWWCWWYGGGFGRRAFIDSYALMALCVAVLLQWAVDHAWPWVRVAVIAPLMLVAAFGLYNNIQYYYGAIHWDSMTRDAYFDSLGRIRPSDRFPHLLRHPDYQAAMKGEFRKEK